MNRRNEDGIKEHANGTALRRNGWSLRGDPEGGELQLLHERLEVARIPLYGVRLYRKEERECRPALTDIKVLASGSADVLQVRQQLALPAGQAYAGHFLGEMLHHPSGSTLDAACEDSESGIFLLMAAVSLYAAGKFNGNANPIWLEQACQAADWTLTWVYSWNVPLVPGTPLHAYGFKTDGWSDVSVQNRHLHVYTPAAELLRLSRLLEGEEAVFYKRQAYRTLFPILRTIATPDRLYGVTEPGEHTEQYHQTNFAMRPIGHHEAQHRGGLRHWFMPWITAWTLSAFLDYLDSD